MRDNTASCVAFVSCGAAGCAGFVQVADGPGAPPAVGELMSRSSSSRSAVSCASSACAWNGASTFLSAALSARVLSRMLASVLARLAAAT
jgi:hypothetical protein